MPATCNITVQSDGDFYAVFFYALPDGVTPINISGATFNMGVRRSINDPNTLFRVTSTLSKFGQIQIVDGPGGQFGVWIARQPLLSLPAGLWQQSMIVTLPATSLFPPTINVPIWNGTLEIDLGASR